MKVEEVKEDRRAETCTILQTANGKYTVQGYSLRLTINCYYYKKDSNGWRGLTLYLTTDKRKKWKKSDKNKKLTNCSINSDNV